MTRPALPPFHHTPYDGTSQPFTVGLKPIGEEAWLEPDPFLVKHLGEKKRLFSDHLETVFRAEPDTDAAQQEVLDLLTENLSRFHADTHRVGDAEVEIVATGARIPLAGAPALVTAASLVQEDLVLGPQR